MAETRHRDVQWNLREEGTPTGDGRRSYSYNHIQTALLMDIRDELKALNAVFSCHRFQDVPNKLDRIARNTRRKKKHPTLRVVKRRSA